MTEKKLKAKVVRRTVQKVINVQPPRPSEGLFNPFAEAKAAESFPAPARLSSLPSTSHVTETSLVNTEADASSETSLVSETSHVTETRLVREKNQTLAEMAETIRYGEGHARTNHDYFDNVISRLPSDAQLLWIHLNRYREGRATHTVRLNWGRLEQKTNLSKSTLYRMAKVLKAEGMAEQFGLDLGKGKEQGFRFRLILPTSLVSLTRLVSQTSLVSETDNKRNALKENNKKGINRLTPEEIQSFTSTVTDLLGEGQTIEEVEARFAPNMHAVDWATIRSTALAQAGPKKGK
jgi:hypothetical protein